MKKIAFLCASLFVSSFSFAENVSLNFQQIPLVNFAQATYKSMMHRDYVLSPQVIDMNKPVTISVKDIDLVALPKFVEDMLMSQGITSTLKNGVYYLDVQTVQASSPIALTGSVGSSAILASPLPGGIPSSMQASGGPVGGPAGMLQGMGLPFAPAAPALNDERVVFQPKNRKAEFLVTVLNSVFMTKPAVQAGSSIVISASKEVIEKIVEVANGVDTSPNQVKISATFVEVTTTASNNFGVSAIYQLLGNKLGVKLGDTSTGSISLGTNSFQLVLDALSADGRFKQVSNPTALVDDGAKTAVSFGDSVPTVAGTSIDKNGNSIQQIAYQNSGVLLDVTPHVLGSGKINLSVDGQVSSFSATTNGVNSSPTLSKRQVQTSLTMGNGDIIVIGGLNSNKSVAGSSGFSFLPKSWAAKQESSNDTDLVLILSAVVQH